MLGFLPSLGFRQNGCGAGIFFGRIRLGIAPVGRLPGYECSVMGFYRLALGAPDENSLIETGSFFQELGAADDGVAAVLRQGVEGCVFLEERFRLGHVIR